MKFVIFAILYLLFSINVFGQSITLPKFQYINKPKGLSDSHLEDIYKDHQGFIWIATRNGLNKYDSRTINTYWSDKEDSTTILSNVTRFVFEDKNNDLWVGTQDGICRYNWEKDNFIQVVHRDSQFELPDYNIESLLVDDENNLWIGTYIFGRGLLC